MVRIAYLDCAGGISGDMTLAALVDAGVDLNALNAAIGSLGLPGCRLRIDEVRRGGFRAAGATVECQPEHVHRHLPQILAIIEAGRLTVRQKDTARRIFTRLAEAEAKVHGVPVEQVHFHEVGAADSIADIVGAAVGFDLLGVDRIAASPTPTGSGTITIAHGQCSVPAPATAELLRGIPISPSRVEGELTTPTGAALLAELVEGFGPLPAMKIDRIGYGAGQKEFPGCPNILRLFVGEAVESSLGRSEQVCVLETQLDDAPGEWIGYCVGLLDKSGALDVYTTPIQMKKNRPGVLLSVLCRPEDASRLEEIIFRETTTLGVRRWTADRTVLQRRGHRVETSWGAVEGKLNWLGDDRARFTPEFESCRHVAQQHRVPLRDVYEAAQKAFDEKQVDRGQ